MNLENDVAVITGGAMGLGLSIANELGKAGAKLVLIDINETALTSSIKMLSEKKFDVWGLKCDVSNREEVRSAFDKLIQRFRKIDILVNNAAIAPETPFLECTEDEWDRIMAVNLKGYFNCAQVAVKHMIENKIAGRVVNLSSTLGFRPKARLVAYTATKGAIINLTYSMASELGEYGIRVNAIAPGMIDTPMTTKGFTPMVRKMMISNIPLKRLGMPEEVGKAVVFLCSDYSSFISGHVLIVDGGQHNGIVSRKGLNDTMSERKSEMYSPSKS
ncbi:MAG: SDR family NAD(P)-dependent oxidoreductase [Candidatus Hodarchaeota archaeon]